MATRYYFDEDIYAEGAIYATGQVLASTSATASFPAFSFQGDTDTGMHNNNNPGELRLAVNGTDIVAMTSTKVDFINNGYLDHGTGYSIFRERTDPSAASDAAMLYAKDNGSGKTLLVVRFSSGAIQTIATEP